MTFKSMVLDQESGKKDFICLTSVSIVAKLWAGRSGSGSRQGQGFLSLPHQIGSGTRLSSYPIGTGGC